MANAEQQVVRLMAQEIARAIKKATEDNNKNYVENQLKNFKGSGVSGASGNGGYVGGSIDASQVVGLYSAVAGYIANSPDYAQSGDVDAGRIITTIAGLAAIEIQSATIDTAQIENLYSSYGEFLNLVAKNAEIEGLDVEELRAAISEIGLANIGSASIDWAQIKDLVTDTAIIREGLGGKLYIDRLAVTDAQILSLTTGELVIQAQDGKLYTVYVDENGEVKTELRTIDGTDIKNGTIQGSNIADNTITGALITENAITARELNVSKIFADEALIRAIKAANLDVDDLFANEGFINTLTTNIIKSPSIGKDLDISENSSIVLTEKKIGMVVSSESSESELVLTDDMLNIITDKAQIAANNIDLSANESITAIVKKEVSEVADTIFVGKEPALPVIDMVWLDTSVSPNLFKRWNGEQWVIVNDVADLLERINSAQLMIDANTASIKSVAESTDELGKQIQSAEEKITPDAIIQTVRNRKEYQEDIASSAMTADKFETFVAGSKGIAEMQMTQDKFETFVENSEEISKLEMTPEKFEAFVENSEGIANIGISADKFETLVQNSESIAQISQKADEIDFLIEDGSSNTNIRFTPIAIDAISHNINLKANDEFNLVVGDLEAIIKANSEGITLIAGQVEKLETGAQIFRRDSFPTTEDKVKANDLLIMPTSGRQYQATELKNANIQFYLGSDGALYYSISDEYGNYTVEMQGYDLYSVGFTLSYNEDGTIGVPFVWELVRDLELQERIEKHAETMAEAVMSINNDIAGLQEQIDGNITTWFYPHVPSLNNLPASEWTTDKEKNNHLGDLFYVENTSLAQNGYCYRWHNMSGSYGWTLIKDTDVTKALSDAARAQDTADNKRRVFVSQPMPPYDIGDIWVQGEGGDILRCQTSKATGSYSSTDWVKASKYTDDTAANNAQASVNNLNRLTDIEVVQGTFAQTTRRAGEGIHIFSEIKPKQDLRWGQPWPGGSRKNLFNPNQTYDGDGLVDTTVEGDTFNTQFDSFGGLKMKESDIHPAGTYTVSIVPVSESVLFTVWLYYADNNEEKWITQVNANNLAATFVADRPFKLGIGGVYMEPERYDRYKIQLELGSTATSYAPYANTPPIEGRTGLYAYAGRKNLLPNGVNNGTYGGITLTRNADGSIGVYGTCTEEYVISICGDGVQTGNIIGVENCYVALSPNFGTKIIKADGSEVWRSSDIVYLEPGDKLIWAYLHFHPGEVLNHTVYPQIEIGTSCTEYEPYQGDTYVLDFGKNLTSYEVPESASGLTVSKVDNGFSVVGTATDGYYRQLNIITPFKAGTYTISVRYKGSAIGGGINIYAAYGSTTSSVWRTGVLDGVSNATFNLPNDVSSLSIHIACDPGAAYNVTITDIQLERGSIATPYAPYDAALLDKTGGVIYGGKVDWNSGEMVVTHISEIYDGTESGWYVNTYTNRVAYRSLGLINLWEPSLICSHFASMGRNISGGPFGTIGFAIEGVNESTLGVFFGVVGIAENVDEWRAYLAAQYAAGTPVQVSYNLETPYTIQLTPVQIESLKGLNTVYTDADDGYVEFGHEPVDVCDSTMAPENPKAGKLWLDRSVTPCVLRRWTGSEWETVNDISTIEAVQSALQTRQEKLEEIQRDTALYLKLDNEIKAVRIGQAGLTSEARIDAYGFGVVIANEVYSRFEANRALFGNMELRKPNVGGLAIDALI